jgi:hypothetical protein
MRALHIALLFLFSISLTVPVQARRSPDLVIVVVLDQFPMEYLPDSSHSSEAETTHATWTGLWSESIRSCFC